MNPAQFADEWKGTALTERSAAHSHVSDLCAMLGYRSPTDDDPTGERFAFEKGAEKIGGGDGFPDVWRKGCFAWEYKGGARISWPPTSSSISTGRRWTTRRC